MRHLKKASIVLLFSFATQSFAGVPCDFKGVSVGDKLPAPALMKKLGVSKYVVNPNKDDFKALMPQSEKYGLMASGEMIDWEIGPYCFKDHCKIPYGINIGDNIPASVFVSFDADTHQIHAIDVAINSTYWEELIDLLKNKYGPNWNSFRTPSDITDLQTKHQLSLRGEILIHATGWENPETKEKCKISGQEYNAIFTHHDRLGPFHSMFEIKLISNNL